MDVGTLTYYQEYERNISIRKHRRFASVRLAAVILIVFSFAVFTDARAQATDTIVASAHVQGHIDFKVNLTDFDKAYRGNRSGLEKVLVEIDSMVLDPRLKVKRITVVGTASPEGPYRNNVRLAAGRAKTFVSILRSRYSFPDSIYVVSTIPEDWEGMRLILADDSTIPYAEIVLRFIDETERLDSDAREHRLKCLDGGRPYASMRDNVLPYLRRASVCVEYDTLSFLLRQRLKTAGPTLGPALPVPDIRPAVIPSSTFTPPDLFHLKSTC